MLEEQAPSKSKLKTLIPINPPAKRKAPLISISGFVKSNVDGVFPSLGGNNSGSKKPDQIKLESIFENIGGKESDEHNSAKGSSNADFT